MAKIDELTDLARDWLSHYSDEQILVSQKHTAPNEAEILDRLAKIKARLGGTPMALSAIVNVLRERRCAHPIAWRQNAICLKCGNAVLPK